MRAATRAVFPAEEHFRRTFATGIELFRAAERAEFRAYADFVPAFDAFDGMGFFLLVKTLQPILLVVLLEERSPWAYEQIQGKSEDGREENDQEQGKRLDDDARRSGGNVLDDPYGHGEPDDKKATDQDLDDHFEGERRRKVGQKPLEFLDIENGGQLVHVR